MSVMDDFDIENGVLTEYLGSDRDVIIPDGVTGIGSEAFRSSELTGVTIPDSVTSIGAYAFSRCSGLKTISVSGAVGLIGRDAFPEGTGYTIVIRGRTGDVLRQYLKENAKWRNVDCQDVSCSEVPGYARTAMAMRIAAAVEQGKPVPDPVYKSYLKYMTDHRKEWFADPKWVSDHAAEASPVIRLLMKEKKIAADEIDGLTERVGGLAGPELLARLTAYRQENVPPEDHARRTEKEIRTMERDAAVRSDPATRKSAEAVRTAGRKEPNVSSPDESILPEDHGRQTKKECRGIERGAAVRSDPVPRKHRSAVWTVRRKEPYVNSLNEVGAVVVFPTQIGNTTVKGIADGFEFVGDDRAREKVEEIVIPEGYTYIGENAFSGCTRLWKITLPGSIARICSSAFDRCENLKTICFGSLDKWLAMDISEADANPLCYGGTLYLEGECPKNLIIPEGTVRIAPNAFEHCSQLTGVAFPDSVKIIGAKAFSRCGGLTAVHLPRQLEQIGKRAFAGCRGLTSVMIPDSVTEIGFKAFSDCEDLAHVVIPGRFVHQLRYVFKGCMKLRDVRFSGEVSDTGDDEVSLDSRERMEDTLDHSSFDDEHDSYVRDDHKEIPYLKDVAGFRKMFVFGETVPFRTLQNEMASDDNISRLARQLIWDADGVRFCMDGSDCFTCNGWPFTPAGSVTLAHPAELDAEEILAWRELLSKRQIIQPFRQLWEPVVLCGGTLKGKLKTVKSAGETYRMSCRYEGAVLNDSALRILKREGFDIIIREKRNYDGRGRKYTSEIDVVNIVTPMGILYDCQPIKKADTWDDPFSFDDEEPEFSVGKLLPFDGVRLRTVNHAAVVLERMLMPWLIRNDKFEILLPYLAGAGEKELRKIYALTAGTHGKIRDAVAEIAAWKGIGL